MQIKLDKAKEFLLQGDKMQTYTYSPAIVDSKDSPKDVTQEYFSALIGICADIELLLEKRVSISDFEKFLEDEEFQKDFETLSKLKNKLQNGSVKIIK